jgi:hypothetical protein
MKKLLTILMIIAFTGQIFAGKGIIVEQKYNSPNALGAGVSMVWYVTDGACKLKMIFGDKTVAPSNTYFIPDVKSGSILSYNESAVPPGVKKSYFVIPSDKIQSDKGMEGPVTVTKTGETQDISGFTCEKIVVKTASTETEIWVTKDLKVDFYKYYPYFKNNYELLGLYQEKIKGMPLSSVTKDLNGKVISSLELVSATKADLKDSDFQVPAEYEAPVRK